MREVQPISQYRAPRTTVGTVVVCKTLRSTSVRKTRTNVVVAVLEGVKYGANRGCGIYISRFLYK